MLQIGALLTAERAAGSGYPQLANLAGLLAQKALVDGAVLGVDGHKTPRLCRHRHDKIAAHHQRLLVGKGKHLARFQRLIARLQTGSAHQRIHHHVYLGQMDKAAHGIGAEADGGRGIGEAGYMPFELGNCRRARRIGRPEGDMPHPEFLGLRKQIGAARACGKRHYFQAIRMPTGHIERLGADRASRPQYGDAALYRSCASAGSIVTGHRVCTLLR